jgi:hypothetical protein
VDECKLRSITGMHSVVCDGDDCIYWRIAQHAGLEGPEEGCALQYFGLIDGGEDIARWLLSVKSRMEAADPLSSDEDSPGAD